MRGQYHTRETPFKLIVQVKRTADTFAREILRGLLGTTTLTWAERLIPRSSSAGTHFVEVTEQGTDSVRGKGCHGLCISDTQASENTGQATCALDALLSLLAPTVFDFRRMLRLR